MDHINKINKKIQKARLQVRMAQQQKRHSSRMDSLKDKINAVEEKKPKQEFTNGNLDKITMKTTKGVPGGPERWKGTNTVVKKNFYKSTKSRPAGDMQMTIENKFYSSIEDELKKIRGVSEDAHFGSTTDDNETILKDATRDLKDHPNSNVRKLIDQANLEKKAGNIKKSANMANKAIAMSTMTHNYNESTFNEEDTVSVPDLVNKYLGEITASEVFDKVNEIPGVTEVKHGYTSVDYKLNGEPRSIEHQNGKVQNHVFEKELKVIAAENDIRRMRNQYQTEDNEESNNQPEDESIEEEAVNEMGYSMPSPATNPGQKRAPGRRVLSMGEQAQLDELEEGKLKDIVTGHMTTGKGMSYEKAVKKAQSDLDKMKASSNTNQMKLPMKNEAEHEYDGVPIEKVPENPKHTAKMKKAAKMFKSVPASKRGTGSGGKRGGDSGFKPLTMGEDLENLLDLSDLQEDGHTDVASARRKAVLIMEDAMQILMKLRQMQPEGSLPSWWMNKISVASSMLDGARNYMVVPTEVQAPEVPMEANGHKEQANAMAKKAVAQAVKSLSK